MTLNALVLLGIPPLGNCHVDYSQGCCAGTINKCTIDESAPKYSDALRGPGRARVA